MRLESFLSQGAHRVSVRTSPRQASWGQNSVGVGTVVWRTDFWGSEDLEIAIVGKI
mgnify:CR=1 FL=1